MFDKKWLTPLVGLGLLLLLVSFKTEEANYVFPLDTYRALSGTFGELRSNHFHSGIDLKTGGKSGAQVKAIEDGHVYRIYVSPFGYGNALYLRHADGNFSVYAHLSRFSPKVEDFLRNKQYTSKRFNQDLYLAENEIRFARGELIAWSGNSGGSLGPHLHFEIRDPQERILNPLRWYRNSLEDTRPPVIQLLGLEPLDMDSRVEGTFDKKVFTPLGENGRYRIDQVIRIKGRVGIEYQAFDLLNAAGNHCGINYAKLDLDGDLLHEFSLERYAFDEKRYINVHFDYGYYQQRRKKMERAYVEPGNRFPANRPIADQGRILLEDDEIHQLTLTLMDFHGNTSTLQLRVQRDQRPELFPSTPTYYAQPELIHEVRRNVLILRAKKAHSSYRGGLLVESIYGDKSRLMPAYMIGSEMVFLLPLDRYRFPKTIEDEIGRWRQDFQFVDELLPFQNNLIEQGGLKVFVPYQAVFDRVPLELSISRGTSGIGGEVYRIGNPSVPLFEPFLVSIQPPENWQGPTLVVARKAGDKWKYVGASRGEGGEILGSSLEFGEFCLMSDGQPPVIHPTNFTDNALVASTQDRLTLSIKDNFSEVDHETIYGTLDGEWVLFEYDYRPGSITYQWKDRPAPGWHDLEITARDQAGNFAQKRFRIRF